jgi:2-dehydro-3-deoxygluconokinase
MGLKTSFVTRLTRNPLGRLVANRSQQHGVDTSHTIWTDDDRVGTYYVEFGASPRANSVLYDRADSAIARIKPGMANWSLIFSRTKLFYTSGITPALSMDAAEATLEAIEAAKRAGVNVCVDLNYRARLWTQKRAREVMTQIVKDTDILFATEEDTFRVFGIQEPSYEDVARRLAETFDLRVVAITLRRNPSVWRNTWTAIAFERSTGTVHKAPTYDIEVVDRNV